MSKASWKGVTGELPGTAEKVMKVVRMYLEEKAMKLSITERGKEGKSNVIALYSYLGETFQEDCGKRGGAGLATSVETLGVDLSARTKQLKQRTKQDGASAM